jgi:hypothetical protein
MAMDAGHPGPVEGPNVLLQEAKTVSNDSV